jgi:hypothetical protein
MQNRGAMGSEQVEDAVRKEPAELMYRCFCLGAWWASIALQLPEAPGACAEPAQIMLTDEPHTMASAQAAAAEVAAVEAEL